MTPKLTPIEQYFTVEELKNIEYTGRVRLRKTDSDLYIHCYRDTWTNDHIYFDDTGVRWQRTHKDNWRPHADQEIEILEGTGGTWANG